ncbi:MAG: adenylate kinase, partial [Nitrospinae bacterium]|nr:adenylate kinase [Nitrospinota bacterium]
ISRLAGRSTCPDCGGMFHEKSCPPKVSGICDGCGGALAQRQDDNEETILKRLDVYKESTAPLKEYYKNQGNLKSVTASGSVEEIFSRVLEMVK